VKELCTESKKDIDFITRNTQVRADWTGKFVGQISKFHLYISTHPGGKYICIVTFSIKYYKTLDNQLFLNCII
jgi:hypothetical protein